MQRINNCSKWSKGYECRDCGNKKYVVVAQYHSRECTKYRYIESATTNTHFYKVKFGVQKAF